MSPKRLVLLGLLLCVTSAFSQVTNTWTGYYGNWSDSFNWSAGLPDSSSDVFISNWGSNVTLDTSANINSLVLGTPYCCTYVNLQGNGTGQSLVITGPMMIYSGDVGLGAGDSITANADSLSNGYISLNGGSLTINGNFSQAQNYSVGVLSTGGASRLQISGTVSNGSFGDIIIGGWGDVANFGGLVNSGYVAVGNGATLNLTNQPGGITDVVAGSRYDIQGTFSAGANSAFVNLQSIEGSLTLENGQTNTITPGTGVLTIATYGNLYVNGGATVNIVGDLSTASFSQLSLWNGNLNVSGTLTLGNSATLMVFGFGSNATLGTLVNNGLLQTYSGTTVTVTNSMNLTDIPSGSGYDLGGTFTVAGDTNPFGSLQSIEGSLTLANGQTATIAPGSGSLAITGGSLTVHGGSTITVVGDLNLLSGSTNVTMGTLNVGGTMTVGPNSYFNVGYNYGPPGVANLNALVSNGSLSVGAGSVLTVTQPMSITDIAPNTYTDIAGTFTAGGSSNPFGSLQSIEGHLTLENGQTYDITPATGMLLMAPYSSFNVSNGTTVNINGNVDNFGGLNTGSYYFGPTGSVLNISGALTIEPYATLNLGTAGDTVTVGSLVNYGYLSVMNGATLILANQPGGITDIPQFANFGIQGNFLSGGQSALANLTTIEGSLNLNTGSPVTITPNGGTLTIAISGLASLYGGVNINGSVDNFGGFTTQTSWTGPGSVSISGGLLNEPFGYMYVSSNVTAGTLTNLGNLTVAYGSTLTLTNQSTPVTQTLAGSNFNLYGSIVAGAGEYFGALQDNQGGITFEDGLAHTITPGTGILVNGPTGSLTLYSGSSLLINGDVSNFGSLNYNGWGSPAGQITGTLTNNPGSNLTINGYGAILSIGSLVNLGNVLLYGGNLDLTNQPGGITDIPAGGSFNLFGGTITANGQDAFANLSTIEGTLNLSSWQPYSFHPSAAGLQISSTGTLYLQSGSLDLTSDIHNAGNVNIWATLNMPNNVFDNQAGGTFHLGYSTTANIGGLQNQGTVLTEYGSTLNLLNQSGITDVPAGATYNIQGAILANGVNPFTNLTTVEGSVYLGNYENINITPNGGVLDIASTGTFMGENSVSLNIAGDVQNYGTFGNLTSYSWSPLNVSGTVYNNLGGHVSIQGYSPTNFGQLVNLGNVFLGYGASLNLTNQPGGITDIPVTASYNLGGVITAGGHNALSRLQSIEGTLVLANYQTTFVTPAGGTLNIAPTGQVSLQTYNTNLGVLGNLHNAGSIGFDSFYYWGTNNLIVSGTFANDTTGQVFMDSYSSNLFAGHILNTGNIYNSNGFMQTPFLENGGFIGNTAGILVGNGYNGWGYTQLPDGILGEIITPSQAGLISVWWGYVQLDGTLHIELAPGFNPANGSQFQILEFSPGSLTGTFAKIDGYNFNNGTEYFTVVYDNADGEVYLQANAVPEPASLLLLASGVLSLCYGARRRWQQ